MQIFAPQSLLCDQDGQTMAEYAVLLGGIVFACVAVFGLLSDAIFASFGNVITTITEIAP